MRLKQQYQMLCEQLKAIKQEKFCDVEILTARDGEEFDTFIDVYNIKCKNGKQFEMLLKFAQTCEEFAEFCGEIVGDDEDMRTEYMLYEPEDIESDAYIKINIGFIIF